MSGMSYWSINVYRQDGSDMSGLNFLVGNLMGQVVFNVQAGSTYYIQAGPPSFWSVPWWERSTSVSRACRRQPTTTSLTRHRSRHFPSRTAWTSRVRPWSSGEPAANCGGDFIRSVWYAFTPSESKSYTVGASTPERRRCQGLHGNVAGQPDGDRVWLIGNGRGRLPRQRRHDVLPASRNLVHESGLLQTGRRRCSGAPPRPVRLSTGARATRRRSTTSACQGQYYDPIGIDSWNWNFGDGATATRSSPQRRYAKDGDYSVTVAVTTPDGRANSNTQVVRGPDARRGHPVDDQLAGVVWGRPTPIQVGINNMRYPESVRWTLQERTGRLPVDRCPDRHGARDGQQEQDYDVRAQLHVHGRGSGGRQNELPSRGHDPGELVPALTRSQTTTLRRHLATDLVR